VLVRVAPVVALTSAEVLVEAGLSTFAYQYQSATRAMMRIRQPALRKQPFIGVMVEE
jgi:hypothetical protein